MMHYKLKVFFLIFLSLTLTACGGSKGISNELSTDYNLVSQPSPIPTTASTTPPPISISSSPSLTPTVTATPKATTPPKTPNNSADIPIDTVYVPAELPDPDGQDADISKPAQVYILMGQSNMVGAGKVKGLEGSLENAVNNKGKYPYLVDDAGKWTTRKDVRNVRVMVGRSGGMQVFNNEWMTINGGTIGPEFGIGHVLGHDIDAPILLLKSCIGNRSLGWDLLPPGSKRSLFADKLGKKVYAGYKDRPPFWTMDPIQQLKTEPPAWLDDKGAPIQWYAGKQYDDDTANAKKVLAELSKYYPGTNQYEVAGFFFWQGEKDVGNTGHTSMYEKNLVAFINQLRFDFNAPNAKFVLGTLGEAKAGIGGNSEIVLRAQLAVDGRSGKHPLFKGDVSTVFTYPLAQGGSGNGHYGGNAEVYMEVGESMGKAMLNLLTP